MSGSGPGSPVINNKLDMSPAENKARRKLQQKIDGAKSFKSPPKFEDFRDKSNFIGNYEVELSSQIGSLMFKDSNNHFDWKKTIANHFYMAAVRDANKYYKDKLK